MSQSDTASFTASSFQREVAQLFFTLPESAGFAVAGGAAVIAHGLVERLTVDLDLFASKADVPRAATALVDACRMRGWRARIDPASLSSTFARLLIAKRGMSMDDALLVDLALDAPPLLPNVTTQLGPTLAPRESAGQKTLALFGRAAPRDFVDVFALAQAFGADALLRLAAERDPGFDRLVFAEMLTYLDKITDDQLDIDREMVGPLRAFYANWREELSSNRNQ